MKKITVFLIVAALSIFMVQCSKRDNPVAPEIPHGTLLGMSFTSDAITGNIMNDFPNRDVFIYTPPGYLDSIIVDGTMREDTTHYPVLYLLHGYSGDHNYFRAIYGLGTTLDQMIYDGEINPMIIVTPNATNSLGGSFYTNSPNFGEGSFAGNMEDFIINETIPLIDSTFRTIADRDHRAIAGHSMGGYGALKLSMLHSDMFCATASMSGPISFWGTMPVDDTTSGFLEPLLLQGVYAENGFAPFDSLGNPVGDPEGFNNITPGPGKRLTNMMFAMGSAFSPHDPANSDMSHAHSFTTDQYTGDIDLMFDVNGQVDTSLFTSVWGKWRLQDVTTMLVGGGFLAFENMAVYVDCGDSDDLGLYGHAGAFAFAFQTFVQRELDFFEVYPAIGDNYPASHTAIVAARLPYVFNFVDDAFATE